MIRIIDPSRCPDCGARLGRRVVSHYCDVNTAASMRKHATRLVSNIVDPPRDEPACDACGLPALRAHGWRTFNPDGQRRRFVCGACATAGYIEACQS